MMSAKALIATATTFVLTATSAAAGTIVDMAVKNAAGTTTDEMRMTIDGSKLRMDTEVTNGEPRTSVIFRGDRDEMIILDHSKSEAMLIDKATMRTSVPSNRRTTSRSWPTRFSRNTVNCRSEG